MPPESELFTLRERQRRQAKEQRAVQMKLKVHEKSTYTSRLNTKNAALRKKVGSVTAYMQVCVCVTLLSRIEEVSISSPHR